MKDLLSDMDQFITAEEKSTKRFETMRLCEIGIDQISKNPKPVKVDHFLAFTVMKVVTTQQGVPKLPRSVVELIFC